MVSSSATVMTGSNLSYDTEEMCEKQSDDDNLESLRRKVTNLIIDTASSNSSNRTIIKHISPIQTSESKGETAEKNNNITLDSDEEDFYDQKKFNYLVRMKRLEYFFLYKNLKHEA